MKKMEDSLDERYHFEIWKGPSAKLDERNPSLSYCENHNADFDYDLAATDFEIATDVLIEMQVANPHFGNWTAPVCFMVRQMIELKLKSLVQFIGWYEENETPNKLLYSHNLEKLWNFGRTWLIDNGYALVTDARLSCADGFVENFHAIDPLGDLFRFGTSKKEAFGRNKTYDRVGYNQSAFFKEYNDTRDCVGHWGSVLMRAMIEREEGWAEDSNFNADDFPKA